MTVQRVVFVLSSVALAVLLSACQCQVGTGPSNSDVNGPGVAGGPSEPGEDPADVALKPLDGKVKREGGTRDGAVIEVALYKQGLTDADLKELAQFVKLRKLEFSAGQTFTGTGFKDIAGLPLQELRLSFTAVNDEGLKEVAKIKTLKVLDLTNARSITDDGLRALASLGNLEVLRIGQTRVMDVGVSRAIAGMPKLRRLEFGNAKVGDGALAQAAKTNPEMRELIMHGSAVTDAGMVYVGKLPHLEELWTNTGRGMSDKGLEAIAGLKELRSLDCNNSYVTFAGLIKSPLLPRLKKLHIGGPLQDGITPGQVEKLRAAAPECNIIKD